MGFSSSEWEAMTPRERAYFEQGEYLPNREERRKAKQEAAQEQRGTNYTAPKKKRRK